VTTASAGSESESVGFTVNSVKYQRISRSRNNVTVTAAGPRPGRVCGSESVASPAASGRAADCVSRQARGLWLWHRDMVADTRFMLGLTECVLGMPLECVWYVGLRPRFASQLAVVCN
jgi:hypothetical protein